MGYVLIVSLPMVIFFIILCFVCYVMGRNKGQQEGRAMAAQELGINNPHSPTMGTVAGGGFVMGTATSPPPLPPPQYPPPAFPSPSPHHPNPPMYLKQQQNGINVV